MCSRSHNEQGAEPGGWTCESGLVTTLPALYEVIKAQVFYSHQDW